MGIKEVSRNRKAYHDYEIIDTYEAGMVLKGTEIKSIRNGKVQLKEAYVSFKNGEATVKGMNISAYDFGNRNNHEEMRDRKLLLHKHEINKLASKCKLQGLTVIPLKLYLKDSRAKLEIGLARGKSLYDKRQDDRIKTMNKEALKALRK